MIRFVLFIVLILNYLTSFSQADNKYVRKGNKDYLKDKYADAEILYRKAIDKKPDSKKANYNLGNSLYKQEKYEAAQTKYENLAVTETNNKIDRSKYFYNLGNTYFKENKLNESIEAYKNALRNQPNDADAKHNLQLAQNMKAAQQQQQQQQQNQQDKNKEQDQKDQQQDQKEQQQQQDQKEQQQQQPQQISREDAERLLDEISREEKDVLKKVQLQKAQSQKIPVDKNW